MSSEVPFYLRSDKGFWSRSNSEEFADVMPVYHAGLQNLITHLQSVRPDGILTLGYSARDMWFDVTEAASRAGVALPAVVNVVGAESGELYSGSIPYMTAAYKRLGVDHRCPLIIDDYAETGRKFMDLHKLFSALNLPVSYAALCVTSHARAEFAYIGIQVFAAIEPYNSRIFELLQSRRSSGHILT